ncbi:hypothetical protein AVEN_146323-1 [Araneus ventricosus]|uniref:Uncharacterized protein n=1 Tax=Araneus ventricosus TaxID=182803 RepID=A0A4Y2JAB3_ARAVE|nr:hypothetical protein AVEN_146323-1 [Araneus ventricosus]
MDSSYTTSINIGKPESSRGPDWTDRWDPRTHLLGKSDFKGFSGDMEGRLRAPTHFQPSSSSHPPRESV